MAVYIINRFDLSKKKLIMILMYLASFDSWSDIATAYFIISAGKFMTDINFSIVILTTKL